MHIGTMTIPGIPGMRMVVFSLALLCIILFRREDHGHAGVELEQPLSSALRKAG